MYLSGQSESELINALIKDIRAVGGSVRVSVGRHLRRGYRTDLLVEKDRKKIAVEVKLTPITLASIRHMKSLRVQHAIICAPSEALADTAGSVLEYATLASVNICDIDQVADLIARL